MKIPDFIVVKASASLHRDRILMVVEVKPASMPDDAAMEQIAAYFSTLARKTTLDGEPLFDRLQVTSAEQGCSVCILSSRRAGSVL